MKSNVASIRFFAEHISPNHLFCASLICFPAFLFQRSIIYAAFQLALCVVLVFLRKGKVRLLPSFFIAASIIFFSILNPYGKIIFRIGEFPITLGAIEGGVRRAITLLGMVFISQFSLSQNLHIPGRLGGFIGTMFYYFERITATKVQFKMKTILKDIDDRLYDVYFDTETLVALDSVSDEKKDLSAKKTKGYTDIWGALFLVGFITIMWTAFALAFVLA